MLTTPGCARFVPFVTHAIRLRVCTIERMGRSPAHANTRDGRPANLSFTYGKPIVVPPNGLPMLPPMNPVHRRCFFVCSHA